MQQWTLWNSRPLSLDEMICDAAIVDNAKEKDDKSVLTLTVGLQYLGELQKVLSSMEHAEEKLSYNKNDNFIAVTHIQNLKQTKKIFF